jgi:hypothetical protein
MWKVNRAWDPTQGYEKTSRSEMYGAQLFFSTEYWVGNAFYFTDDFFDHGGYVDVDLADFHAPFWAGNGYPETPNFTVTSPPASIYFGKGEANRLVASNNWSDSLAVDKPTIHYNPAAELLANTPRNTWVYVVRRIKPHWDISKGPFYYIWVAVGNGPLVQKLASTQPNTFRTLNPMMSPKEGVYQWENRTDSAWGSKPTRTLYTKGMMIFKAGTPTGNNPPLNEQTILNTMRGM